MLRAFVFLLLAAGAAVAQDPFMQAFMPRYNVMKQNLVESAEAMPAEHYSFRLSPAQRTFGDWIDHTVMLLHSTCSGLKGGSSAMDHSKHAGDRPKGDLTAALKEAAALCDSTFAGMTDKDAMTVAGKSAPVAPMLGLLTNMSSHYGNMVGYLRAKNIVPPSTARAQKR